MKILQVSDEHIREKDAEEIDRCLQFIVETAQREQPGLIVSCGDLFDSRDVRVDSKAAIMAIGFVSALMDVAPVAIVLGTPSHDGAAPRIMQYVRGTFPVIVAEKPMQVILSGDEFNTEEDNEGHGLQAEAVITLIPQPTKQYWQSQSSVSGSDQEIGQAMSGLFAGFGAEAAEYPGVPHVLVYHGCVSGGKASNSQVMTGRDIEVSTDQLAMTGAHLILCGHLHLPQELPGNIFYSGSVYMNNIGELHPHGFYVHEIQGIDLLCPFVASSRFIETPARKVVRFSNNFATENGHPDNLLDLMAPEQDITGAHVRLDITVYQDEADKIDRAAIEAAIMGAAASRDIRITRIPRETVRAESVLKAETLRQKIEEAARIKGETVEPAVLDLADLLAGSKAEELLKSVVSAGGAA